MSSSLDERANLSNLSNVANEILIDEINQKDGVFRDEKIDRVGNILVGEKVSNFFLNPVQRKAPVKILPLNKFQLQQT